MTPTSDIATHELPQVLEIHCVGPVNGMGERHPEGSYVAVIVTLKNGDVHRYKLSKGGAGSLADEINATIESQKPSAATHELVERLRRTRIVELSNGPPLHYTSESINPDGPEAADHILTTHEALTEACALAAMRLHLIGQQRERIVVLEGQREDMAAHINRLTKLLTGKDG